MERHLVLESYPWETRVAVIENGRLVEMHLEEDEDRVGNIYKGKVKDILPGLSCAFIDLGFEKNAFLYQGDLAGAKPGLAINHLLAVNQEIIVQVKKEESPDKGARVATNLSIPGYYLVLLPQQNEVNLSRKIKDPQLRENLREYLKEIKPENMGLILRTAGSSVSLQELNEELNELVGVWNHIMEVQQQVSAPALLYKDLNVIQRALRDYADDMTKTITVNSAALAVLKEYHYLEGKAASVKIKLEDRPFDQMGLEHELKRLLSPRVWLKSGGFLLIEETEAMTVIDINTGKYTGKNMLEETILQINLEAAREIPRQLRLRGIGGIILMDFIDMKNKNHQDEVLAVLEQELKKDKAHSRVLGMTKLGLVEMTRKKTRLSMSRLIARECRDCGGRGRVLNEEYAAHDLMRALMGLGHRRQDRIRVEVTPALMEHLETESKHLDHIKSTIKKDIVFLVNEDLNEPYRINS